MEKYTFKQFSNYLITHPIAKGGMGSVFLALPLGREPIHRFVAIKQILPDLLNDASVQSQFQNEIEINARLIHRNIVRILDFDEFEGQPYMALEYIDGCVLHDLISEASRLEKPFPIPVSLYIIRELIRGLEFAHGFGQESDSNAKGVLHLDLSPHNVLLSYTGEVKLTDFGIAQVLDGKKREETSKEKYISGKLGYAAPQQLMGETPDGRTDLYSLGVLAWEILTGNRLYRFQQNDTRELFIQRRCTSAEPIAPVSWFNQTIPMTVDIAVSRLLAFDPQERYQSASELRKVFDSILEHEECSQVDLSLYIKDIMSEKLDRDFKLIEDISIRAAKHFRKKKLAIAATSAPAPVMTAKQDKAELAVDTLAIGQTAPDFVGTTYDGNIIDTSCYRGEKLWVMIYRYANCPLCNLHLSQVVDRFEELKAAGISLLAVFESDRNQFIKSGTGKIPRLILSAPFPLVADPDRAVYHAYKTKKNLFGVLRPSVLFHLIRATLRKYLQGSIDGEFSQLPAHFLIDEKGKIEVAYYGRSIIDHLPWELVERFKAKSTIGESSNHATKMAS